MTGRYKADRVHKVRNVCDEVVFDTAITVLSVAKSYSNRGNHCHSAWTKKRVTARVHHPRPHTRHWQDAACEEACQPQRRQEKELDRYAKVNR